MSLNFFLFWFCQFSYSLKWRVGISNYATCTTAVETLQQNIFKGPSTVSKCTAWLLTYFNESLRQAKKRKNNKHLWNRSSSKKKKIPIIWNAYCGKVYWHTSHLFNVDSNETTEFCHISTTLAMPTSAVRISGTKFSFLWWRSKSQQASRLIDLR